MNEILCTRQLHVSRCDVFTGDQLLYLFYGRPGYRPKNDDLTSLELWRALITFVVSTAAVINIARIFPFDSGAYSQGLYTTFTDTKFQLEEFQLPTDMSTPPKVVGAFFGTNQAYWDGNIRSKCEDELDLLDFHSQVYADMNSSRQPTKFDCRAGIVEIQSLDPMPLNTNTLEAIVVPDRLLSHKEIKALASDCNAELLSYRWRKDRASERAGDIDDAIMKWHQSRGVL